MRNQLDNKLDTIITEIFELDPGEISNELTPEDIDTWDSLNHMRLITAIEKAFKIRFSMNEVMSISSISSLRELVQAHAS